MLNQDLLNPSPGLGWASEEVLSLRERGPVDLVMALALVHHLAIGGNVKFSMMAEWFAGLGEWLVVEFVPKTDKKVKLMLAQREDVFGWYNKQEFVESFEKFYKIESRVKLDGSKRELMLMRRR